MSYKTILVHVDETRRAGERIRIAASLALADNAHLTGIALTGVSRFLFQPAAIEMDSPSLSAHLAMLHERANRGLENFEHLARTADVTSFDARLVDDEASAGIALQARYGDLVVIGQNDPDERSPAIMPDFPEFVVMNAGRPVLIVPSAGRFQVVGNRVMIAWDASMEATRAVTAALPILKRAAIVEVVVFNPSSIPDAHGEQAGADIALFLARHGVIVEVLQQQADADIGNALLSTASDLSSDLMVMGAYGHSRFREVLLGGATRTVLDSMTLPVLMMH